MANPRLLGKGSKDINFSLVNVIVKESTSFLLTLILILIVTATATEQIMEENQPSTER